MTILDLKDIALHLVLDVIDPNSLNKKGAAWALKMESDNEKQPDFPSPLSLLYLYIFTHCITWIQKWNYFAEHKNVLSLFLYIRQ